MNYTDTIYALASAPGKSGVAVIRISGPQAQQALIHLGVTEPLKPRHATLVTLHSPLATRHPSLILDRALALYFPTPNSFTGEDIIELHTHGSRAVTKLLLEALNANPNLRLAEPGEFTRRAFLNGKLDLLEAEGLADLIDADTPAQHAQAMRQLGGELSAQVMGLREKILMPLALLEAYIDFPDEEIPESVLAETNQRIEALIKEIKSLLNDGGIGEKIREGLEIVIFGPPNAGKSSLLNAIAKRDIAIVSPEAGTTRDLIEVHLNIDGYAATLIDTAGLREAAGVEAEGIRRARERLAKADLKLAIFDSVTMSEQMSKFASLIDESTLLIANKSDLNPSPLRGEVRRGPSQGDSSPLNRNPLPLSTKTGEGLDQLLNLLKETIAQRMESVASPLITRARHREAFALALAALERFSSHAPLELACEELRLAATAIGKITGKILVDDILDVVFSRFCIGK